MGLHGEATSRGRKSGELAGSASYVLPAAPNHPNPRGKARGPLGQGFPRLARHLLQNKTQIHQPRRGPVVQDPAPTKLTSGQVRHAPDGREAMHTISAQGARASCLKLNVRPHVKVHPRPRNPPNSPRHAFTNKGDPYREPARTSAAPTAAVEHKSFAVSTSAVGSARGPRLALAYAIPSPHPKKFTTAGMGGRTFS